MKVNTLKTQMQGSKRCHHRGKQYWNLKKSYRWARDSSPRSLAKWDHTLLHSCWEKIPRTSEDQPWIWERRSMDKSGVFRRKKPCFQTSCCSYKRSQWTADRRAAKQVWVPRQATLHQSDRSNVAGICGAHGGPPTIFPPLFHKLLSQNNALCWACSR